MKFTFSFCHKNENFLKRKINVTKMLSIYVKEKIEREKKGNKKPHKIIMR